MIVMPTILFGQTFLSCNLKEYCAWNEVTEAWEMDCDPFENNCLFEMNEDETMFVHTTSEMKSTYYIKEKVSCFHLGFDVRLTFGTLRGIFRV